MKHNNINNIILQLHNISKTYPGGFVAIDGIDLQIEEGEFFVLLGPSGCGKSTLLKIIAGLEKPQTGQVILNNNDITKLPPYSRPVNMMFQSYALFPHMNVFDNVAFGLRHEEKKISKKRFSKTQINEKTDYLLHLVQMQNMAKRKPNQLSGGQKQRVALARAIAKQPQILLLDEPLAALDRKLREETRAEIVKLQQKTKITFIFVTHDQEEAMQIATKIAVMDEGKIKQVGKPENIYEKPKSKFVANFIGDINIFECQKIIRHNNKDSNFATAYCSELEKPLQINQNDGKKHSLTIAIRPEKIRLLKNQPENQNVNNQYRAKIIDVVYRGYSSQYLLKLKTGRIIKSSMVNAEQYQDDNFTCGSEVFIHIPPEFLIELF